MSRGTASPGLHTGAGVSPTSVKSRPKGGRSRRVPVQGKVRRE